MAVQGDEILRKCSTLILIALMLVDALSARSHAMQLRASAAFKWRSYIRVRMRTPHVALMSIRRQHRTEEVGSTEWQRLNNRGRDKDWSGGTSG